MEHNQPITYAPCMPSPPGFPVTNLNTNTLTNAKKPDNRISLYQALQKGNVNTTLLWIPQFQVRQRFVAGTIMITACIVTQHWRSIQIPTLLASSTHGMGFPVARSTELSTASFQSFAPSIVSFRVTSHITMAANAFRPNCGMRDRNGLCPAEETEKKHVCMSYVAPGQEKPLFEHCHARLQGLYASLYSRPSHMISWCLMTLLYSCQPH